MTFAEQIKEQAHNIEALSTLWSSLVPEASLPSNTQFGVWLDLHRVEDVLQAIKATANKYRLLKCNMTAEHMIRYCSSVANNLKTRRKAQQ
jgi:hypothetical protein